MSAITGHWAAPSKVVENWYWGWCRRANCPDYTLRDEERVLLAEQMREIRRKYSRHQSKEFRNYLLWIGIYPVKIRRNKGE